MQVFFGQKNITAYRSSVMQKRQSNGSNNDVGGERGVWCAHCYWGPLLLGPSDELTKNHTHTVKDMHVNKHLDFMLTPLISTQQHRIILASLFPYLSLLSPAVRNLAPTTLKDSLTDSVLQYPESRFRMLTHTTKEEQAF